MECRYEKNTYFTAAHYFKQNFAKHIYTVLNERLFKAESMSKIKFIDDLTLFAC
jgi:hypothetical protein